MISAANPIRAQRGGSSQYSANAASSKCAIVTGQRLAQSGLVPKPEE